MNPAELAQPIAEKEMLDGKHEPSTLPWYEIKEYADLQEFARLFQFVEQSFEVRTSRALLLPKDETENPRHFNDLRFVGEFSSYSAVSGPSYMGRAAINGLCLEFENITFLPDGEQSRQVNLYVPAFSIDTIERRAA